VLVGDAGLVMDPITGLGMGHALRDAELAAAAISAGLDQPGRLQAELRRYARRRDRETKPSYDLTLNIAKVRALGDAERAMFAAIAADPQASTRFLATISGSRPVKEFFSPGNLIKLVGIRGFLALARSRP
jgi:2-polyprenyl-6-methoxyphenol hydroxylase-like FAD-dependent oxidoreductase